MRVVFMGTPSFAIPTLETLLKTQHDICCVYSQPPKAAGRGQHLRLSPVHQLALDYGLLVRTPHNIKNSSEQILFDQLNPDVCITVAYGLILPAQVLNAPRFGCLNIHASLLPRWRGAAPIQRAILAGDSETGITVIRMQEELDAGNILLRKSVSIGPKTTAGELYDRLSIIAANLIIEIISTISEGDLETKPQKEADSTYAAKIEKEEARIVWSRPADIIDRQVRAFSPTPGAWTTVKRKRVKILEGEIIERSGVPGTIIDNSFVIACGVAAYRPQILQPEGRRVMTSEEFLRGNFILIDTKMG